MCIIQGSVKKVSNTNILVGRTNHSDRQLTIYSNNIDIATNNPVAMILPFPNYSRNNYVEIVETIPSDAKMFNILNKMFIPFYGMSYTNGGSVTYSSRSDNLLEVLRSGSYRYSVVNNVNAFDRLDQRIFKLTDPNIKILLRKYYSNFGFIVCIIDSSAKYSPFAYISEKMPNDRYFIPTRHYHGYSYEVNNTPHKEYWDHNIYIFGSKDKLETCRKIGVDINFPNTTFNLNNIRLLNDNLADVSKKECKCITIEGEFPNGDIVVDA
jgi:hypothetical protein